MIRTLINKDIQKLDEQVNEFMAMMKRNLPVRTEALVWNGEVIHKATIFFEENFGNTNKMQEVIEEVESVEAETEIKEIEPKPKKENLKIGAIWKQKDGSLSGTINSKRIKIPDTIKQKILDLQESSHLNFEFAGQEVVVFTNKYKTTIKHPDYVLYRRRE
jgi:hypothetical protein